MTRPNYCWRGRPSQLVNVATALSLLLIYFVFEYLVLKLNALEIIALDSVGFAQKFLGTIFLLYFSYRVISVKTHNYGITRHELHESFGVFNRSIHTVELFRVKDYQTEKPLLLRLFGLGNVIIYTSDHTTPRVVLCAVTKPEVVMRGLRNLVDRERESKGVREFD